MPPRPRRTPVCALVAAAALAFVAAAAHAAPAGSPAQQQDATAAKLTNDWRAWRAGAAGSTAGTVRSKSRRILLRMGAGARPGATVFYTLRVPAGVSPEALRFRASFTTTGGSVFVASGTRARRVWTRTGGRAGKRITGSVALKGRRVVIVGAKAAPGSAPRDVTLLIHSYTVTPAAGGAPSPVSAGVTNPPAPATRSPAIYWGARVGGNVYGPDYGDGPWDSRSLALFAQHAGKAPSIVVWGQPWFRNGVAQSFEPGVFRLAREYGAIPMIDWASWEAFRGGHYDQPDFQLKDIIAGNYDAYIRSWASAAAAWGHPFFLRFDHEMNGIWYPYSELQNGNSRGEFVRAWRHVHDIFTQVGADNVTWVWAPNEITGRNDIPLPSLYPGAAYVDWVAMDGYNWGAIQNSRWLTFTQRMGKTYDALRTLAPAKPIMIAEMASSESGGGSKAAWIDDALGVQLPRNYPGVKAVIWWNRWEKGEDWPIETSPSAQAAFARQIGSPYYLSNTFSTLDASPIPAP